MNPNLEKLKAILDRGQADLVTKGEMDVFLNFLLQTLKQLLTQLEAKRTKEYEALTALFQKINTELGAKGESALSLQKETKKLLEEVRQTIPTVPDIAPLEERLNGLNLLSLEDVADNMPLFGEHVRDALELLPKGEKLNIDAIEDLREELDKVRHIQTTKKDSVVYVGGGGGSGGRIVKGYDLSSQLNGSLRVFNTPAMWRVISVHLSSAPNILRPDVDYTWTPQTLTITSEIADISLSSGQTLMLVYAE